MGSFCQKTAEQDFFRSGSFTSKLDYILSSCQKFRKFLLAVAEKNSNRQIYKWSEGFFIGLHFEDPKSNLTVIQRPKSNITTKTIKNQKWKEINNNQD